eukprot:TRINITY_DN4472_c0_g1_i2.p1 TRINITY_DN4472_c0_g1~~TRINITY_DN4472_c0_g1_i2.p1  ORF type:complete len:390 (+),score=87.22 TRINITY_DN4472_c0_g1_i2:566-1735(+)
MDEEAEGRENAQLLRAKHKQRDESEGRDEAGEASARRHKKSHLKVVGMHKRGKTVVVVVRTTCQCSCHSKLKDASTMTDPQMTKLRLRPAGAPVVAPRPCVQPRRQVATTQLPKKPPRQAQPVAVKKKTFKPKSEDQAKLLSDEGTDNEPGYIVRARHRSLVIDDEGGKGSQLATSSAEVVDEARQTDMRGRLGDLLPVRFSDLLKPSHASDDKPQYRFQVVILGDEGVGKTCFFHCLLEKSHDIIAPTERDGDQQAIVVKDYKKKKVKLNVMKRRHDWFFRVPANCIFRYTQGFFVMFDVTRKETYLNARKTVEDIKKWGTRGHPTTVLIANKADLEEDRVISWQEVEDFADQKEVDCCEMSVLNGRHVGKPLRRFLHQQVREHQAGE